MPCLVFRILLKSYEMTIYKRFFNIVNRVQAVLIHGSERVNSTSVNRIQTIIRAAVNTFGLRLEQLQPTIRRIGIANIACRCLVECLRCIKDIATGTILLHIAPLHTSNQTCLVWSINGICRNIISAIAICHVLKCVGMIGSLIFVRSNKPATMYIMECRGTDRFSIRSIFIAEVGSSKVIWGVFNITF